MLKMTSSHPALWFHAFLTMRDRKDKILVDVQATDKKFFKNRLFFSF